MGIYKKNDVSSLPLLIIMVIGAAVLAARFLIWTKTFHSGLLYIAWPFSLSLALYYFTPHTDGTTWKKIFWNNFRMSTIALLAASLILMEGYVCVVMAMPLFFLGFLIAFIADYIRHNSGKNSIKAYVLPLFVILFSLEGVTDRTTFQRYNEVTHSRIVQADVTTIKQRLANPPKPKGKRHWILSIFPMPKSIGAVTMNKGDTRVYEFVYHRWFSANTHIGKIGVTFVDVDEGRIKTKIEDTSYIANYIKLHGTELTFEPLSSSSTRVTLKVAFDRVIDPVWYFGPLERFAVYKASEYFVSELLARGPDFVATPVGEGR